MDRLIASFNQAQISNKKLAFGAGMGTLLAVTASITAMRDSIFQPEKPEQQLDQIVAIVLVPIFGLLGATLGATFSFVYQLMVQFFKDINAPQLEERIPLSSIITVAEASTI